MDSVDERLFIQEVGLNKLKLAEQVTKGFTNRCNLSFAVSITDSATDTETTIL